jgi:hypothetical protein
MLTQKAHFKHDAHTHCLSKTCTYMMHTMTSSLYRGRTKKHSRCMMYMRNIGSIQEKQYAHRSISRHTHTISLTKGAYDKNPIETLLNRERDVTVVTHSIMAISEKPQERSLSCFSMITKQSLHRCLTRVYESCQKLTIVELKLSV